MAEHDSIVHIVGFELESTYAIVKLGGYIQSLVACYVAVDSKGTVVRYNISDVAIFPGAEVIVAITFDGVWNAIVLGSASADQGCLCCRCTWRRGRACE